jgi:hypothetical protein
VVRPVARYRPGARRIGVLQLDPVFFLTQAYVSNQTGDGDPRTGRTVQLFTGSQGKVAEFNPFEIAPFTPVVNSDSGIVAVLERDWRPFDDWRVRESDWFGNAYTWSAPVFQHVIDQTAYISLIRASNVHGYARVVFDVLSSLGTLIGTSTAETLPRTLNCRYDLLTVGVDLLNGSTQHAVSSLYERTIEITEFNDLVSSAIRDLYFTWTAEVASTSLPDAIAATLPAAHPFKACGSQAWSYLAERATVIPTGSYTFESQDVINGNPVPYARLPVSNFTPVTTASARPQMPSSFSFVFSHSLSPVGKPIHDRALAYSTLTDQRIITQQAVTEISTFAEPWTPCTGFDQLYKVGPVSFDDYRQDELIERELVLVLDGLSPLDQQAFAAEPAGDPPASIAALAESNLKTDDPSYFRDQSTRPSFATNAGSYHVGYLIND